jgi:uncharacterized membrane protein YagU involved in acid resistance
VLRLILGGAIGTFLLTVLLGGSQALRWTRINLPYLLGTMLTPDRNRAPLVGLGLHLVNGWIFAGLYFAAFHAFHTAAVWLGVLLGLLHASFVLLIGMPMLPSLHPRMATESQGPTELRSLEPPGFLALHYGRQTPVSILLAHMAYGAVLAIAYGAHG